MRVKLVLGFVAALLGFSGPYAGAADLVVGLGADVTSMDPHFANITSNSNVLLHVFDRLVDADNQRKIQPRLAESWKNIDDLTWEFKLRRGVKFHDGSELTAEDVAYSLDRPATLVNSPTPYTLYTKSIVEKTIVDKYTIRLKTATPNAIMLYDLINIFIISKKATSGLGTEDFNAGRGMIGTGPYKFVQFKRGDRIDLVRNDAYWGSKPAWDKVSLRLILTPAARVAALLSGDVQMIENVPPADISKLKTNPDLNVVSTLSSRVIYLELDQSRDNSPFVTDKAGKPMDKNPLKDYRVRLAISKAINRAAIVDKVMEGNAMATGQLIPLGFWASVPGLKPEIGDVDGAKKLLAQAGYPDGFGLTLHGTNDRYVNDSKILQTVAQMLNRVGINTKVESMPASVFFSRRNKLDFSVGMGGWGGGPGHPFTYLKSLVATYDAKTGFGANNNGRYSNPKVDALVVQAAVTIDMSKQEKLWQQATELAM
ncbi:ABC transporter substrate-binding protein, partial [Undibacterium sp.]|uniref:ABC transporter substrate-binding protein n=1 Tax=Undibacterium sp. TaxID=1914977 RepID=UPI002BB850B2